MAEKLGIIQSRGLGDIVIALPIARHYHDLGWEIHWPICREFLDHFYSVAPWVNWHPVETDRQGTFFWDQPQQILDRLAVTERLCLYQALTGHPEFSQEPYFQHTKFDQYKYIRAGVPFHKKWLLSDCVTRRLDREAQVVERIRQEIGDRPYILIHAMGSDHRASFDTQVLPQDMAAIEINAMTDSVWDWLMAIEQAHSVITVDSVYSNIIDQMALSDDDSRYFIPRSHIGLTPVLGQHWNWLENTSLPAQARTIRA